MVKRRIYKPKPLKENIDLLSHSIHVNPYLSTVLLQRDIRNFEEAKKFFRPSLSDLHNPFLMKDMDRAVERLKLAIDRQEKILVYGDYDVDGTTSIALIYNYLRRFYAHCYFYVPDRLKEGYGISSTGVMWAKEHGISLIIALDLGIKAIQAVKQASQQGIDFIICDHHLPGSEIPNASAVLDPKRKDCNYPFKELSGCGLGFKLLQAFSNTYYPDFDPVDYIDLVAVSIASDLVPINKENRILAYYGLQKLNENPLPGLQALKKAASIRRTMTVSDIVFKLAPPINASGRIAHAQEAVKLLISETEEEAEYRAAKARDNNQRRREWDITVTEEALDMIQSDTTHSNAKSTVLYKENWHEGVIGIVASRCIEKYYRPTIILTESNSKIVGSSRSVKDFDIHKALVCCSDLLEKFGGHKYAAGLTLKKENLSSFRDRFEHVVSSTITSDILTPEIEVDLDIPFDIISEKFWSILKQIAPFGPTNPKPVFEANQVFVVDHLIRVHNKHLRFTVGQEGNKNRFPAIGFDMAEHYSAIDRGNRFSIAFSIEENRFNGRSSLELRIKDIMFK